MLAVAKDGPSHRGNLARATGFLGRVKLGSQIDLTLNVRLSKGVRLHEHACKIHISVPSQRIRYSVY